MAGASDYLEAALLNHVFRASALSSPAAVYVGLYTVAPTDAGGGTARAIHSVTDPDGAIRFSMAARSSAMVIASPCCGRSA